MTNLRNAFPKTEESEEMVTFFGNPVVEELEELLGSAQWKVISNFMYFNFKIFLETGEEKELFSS